VRCDQQTFQLAYIEIAEATQDLVAIESNAALGARQGVLLVKEDLANGIEIQDDKEL